MVEHYPRRQLPLHLSKTVVTSRPCKGYGWTSDSTPETGTSKKFRTRPEYWGGTSHPHILPITKTLPSVPTGEGLGDATTQKGQPLCCCTNEASGLPEAPHLQILHRPEHRPADPAKTGTQTWRPNERSAGDLKGPPKEMRTPCGCASIRLGKKPTLENLRRSMVTKP
jgi:hypothetical protein